jgi:adenine-specific DNA-methyltransferase
MKLGPYQVNSIVTGDATELADALPDKCIDLIFTDPPYPGEYLPVYYSIFQHAARILKPNGFLLTYVGGYWKDEIMAEARRHLKYFWDYIVWEPGNSPVNWPRKTIARNKSILAYTRKDAERALPNTQVLSVWLGGGEDKRFHVWGQDESQARYFIDCFSKPGDMVLDFCAGGGTTPYMAKMLDRKYLAFEIDPEMAEASRDRVRSFTQRQEGIGEMPEKQTETQSLLMSEQ